jgi:hypothetical protein
VSAAVPAETEQPAKLPADEQAVVLVDEGIVLVEEGRLEEARWKFKQAQEFWPLGVAALLEGEVEFKQGRLGDARDAIYRVQRAVWDAPTVALRDASW